jgi:glycosyltransferase involved in cell wall biosynthesis
MKVIVLCPVYNCADTLSVWMKAIEDMNPAPEEVVFCENNSTDATLSLINGWKFPHKLIRIWVKDKPSKNPYTVMAHVRELLRTYARNSGCDYAVFLDSDVIPLDKDFIRRITGRDADVVGGAYMRMFPEGLGVAAYFKSLVGSKYKYRTVKAIRPEVFGAVAVGGGCLCLSKWVLSDGNVTFYPLLKGDIAEDFGYCIKARKRGWMVFIDATLDILHLDTTNKIKPWTLNMDGTIRNWDYGV